MEIFGADQQHVVHQQPAVLLLRRWPCSSPSTYEDLALVVLDEVEDVALNVDPLVLGSLAFLDDVDVFLGRSGCPFHFANRLRQTLTRTSLAQSWMGLGFLFVRRLGSAVGTGAGFAAARRRCSRLRRLGDWPPCPAVSRQRLAPGTSAALPCPRC